MNDRYIYRKKQTSGGFSEMQVIQAVRDDREQWLDEHPFSAAHLDPVIARILDRKTKESN